METRVSASNDPSGRAPIDTARGSYVLLELHAPGEPGIPAGVLLLAPREDRLHVKIAAQWPASLDREDRQVLSMFAEELATRASVEPGEALLAQFEDTFSHLLRLSPRESVMVHRPEREVEALFARLVAGSVEPASTEPAPVIPFRTHLPFYPMRIAAGVFDGDTEVEAAAWVPVPDGLRPEPGYFVGRITGKSMEPRIADGSYCLFRMDPQGSREGKLVLVQKHGTSDSGGAFTIKRYHSEKAPQRPAGDDEFGGDEWRHARVRLISLNPAYPSWDLAEDECRIIAELVRVLAEDEVPESLQDAP